MTNVTAQIAQQLGLETDSGVVITEIEADSPALDTGIRNTDVIIGINQTPIRNAGDLQSAAASLKGRCLVKTLRGYFVIEDKRSP